jgi:Asp-tRNA(Asn)/Glu-tRNA(Gln) amidotransferase A subunit family amidase
VRKPVEVCTGERQVSPVHAHLVRGDEERHPTPKALRAALEKACADLVRAPREVVSTSIAFHLPHDATALAVMTTAEQVANDHDLEHLVHVQDDIYEVRLSRTSAGEDQKQ